MDEPVKLCKYCRKPLSGKKLKYGRHYTFCSQKCANRYNGKKRVGTTYKPRYGVYTAQGDEDNGSDLKGGLE